MANKKVRARARKAFVCPIGHSGTATLRCSKPLASSLTRPDGMSYGSSNILRHIPISPSLTTDPNT